MGFGDKRPHVQLQPPVEPVVALGPGPAVCSLSRGAERASQALLHAVGPARVVHCQKEGFCHMMQGLHHRLEAKLKHFPKDASANPGSKGNEVGLLEGLSGYRIQGSIWNCCALWDQLTQVTR
jgi:hypothetical protein